MFVPGHLADALWERLALIDQYKIPVAIGSLNPSTLRTGAFLRLDSHSTKKSVVSTAEHFVLTISIDIFHNDVAYTSQRAIAFGPTKAKALFYEDFVEESNAVGTIKEGLSAKETVFL